MIGSRQLNDTLLTGRSAPLGDGAAEGTVVMKLLGDGDWVGFGETAAVLVEEHAAAITSAAIASANRRFMSRPRLIRR